MLKMVRALINRKLKPEPQPEPQPKPAKPLALELLKKGSIDPQSSSPLFNFIPKEIRDLIFEHALTAYPDPARPYGSDQRYVRPGVAGHLRVATELLLVCKAIYIETYQLPITLNPVLAYHGFADDVPPHAQRGLDNLRRLAPWQYAALHMIDISMQQVRAVRRDTIRCSVLNRSSVLNVDCLPDCHIQYLYRTVSERPCTDCSAYWPPP